MTTTTSDTSNLNQANSILNLMNALSENQQTLGLQQVADEQSAENNANTESIVYEKWNEVIADDAAQWERQYDIWYELEQISDDPDKFAREAMENGPNQEIQAQQNLDVSKAQAAEGQADATTNTAQSTAASDASNLQTLLQMGKTFIQIATTAAEEGLKRLGA